MKKLQYIYSHGFDEIKEVAVNCLQRVDLIPKDIEMFKDEKVIQIVLRNFIYGHSETFRSTCVTPLQHIALMKEDIRDESARVILPSIGTCCTFHLTVLFIYIKGFQILIVRFTFTASPYV